MARNNSKPLTTAELEQIKTLKADGKTYNAIALQISRDPKTVKRACLEPVNAVEIVKQTTELADLYKDLAQRMLVSINDDDINKLDAYKRTLSAAVSTDKMRLLSDQSTANISVRDVAAHYTREIQKIQEQREQIMAMIEASKE